jgi:hypothetical protein
MERKNSKKSSNNKLVTKAELGNLIVKQIKKYAEHKSFDTGFGSSVNTTGTLQKLSTIPQGDTDSTRDGDQAEVFGVDIIATMANASSGDATNVGRLVVFRWEQDDSSAAPASVADILQTASVYAPYNRDNLRAKKFIVLMDHVFVTSLNGPSIEKLVEKSKTKFKLKFQGSGNTGNSMIYAAMISDSGAIPDPIFSYQVRVWFTDA